ncbi:MAG TPA: DUF2844 domain-containing protein [Candidatus Sulfotelmatobacter sp.]
MTRWLAWRLRRCGLAIGFAALTLPCPVFAALGGDAASVQADSVHMQASLRTSQAATTQGGAYTLHELHSSSGVVVREYVSSAGAVFGVAWQGPWLPDLHQLLGTYFEPYVQAMQARNAGRAGRRPVHIEIPGLVVNLSGHPRSFTGQAYIPENLPQGMKAEDVR